MELYKNMKWMMVIVFIIGMLFFGDNTLAAEKQEQQAERFFRQTDSLEEKEKAQIRKVLNKYLDSQEQSDKDDSKMLVGESVAGQEKYNYDKAYSVIGVDLFLITEFQKKGDFSKLLTGKRQWKVPYQAENGEKGLVTLEEKDGSWEWISETSDDTLEKIPPEKEKIASLIGEQINKNETILDITYAYSILYNMTMIYVEGKKQDYIIPYAEVPEQLNREAGKKGIVNGRVYTDENFITVMNRMFDEEKMKENSNQNGGIPYRQQEDISIKVIIAVVVLFMVSGYLLMRILRHRCSQIRESE